MNITPFSMYWIMRCDDIAFLFMLFAFISGILCLVAYKKSARMFATAVAALLVNMIVVTFMPTTRQMAAIVVIPKIARAEPVNDCCRPIVELAKEWVEGLKPDREGEKK
ncbi:MAG: hypothetical protein MJZ81_10740 [Bacteroidales bacterium]|nr:hypothetical protein [Bacteroidales bacterium]